MQNGQIKLAITQRDEHWPPNIFKFLKYGFSSDFNDSLLKKFFIQEHLGVEYLK